jgi:hypothetical protein
MESEFSFHFYFILGDFAFFSEDDLLGDVSWMISGLDWKSRPLVLIDFLSLWGFFDFSFLVLFVAWSKLSIFPSLKGGKEGQLRETKSFLLKHSSSPSVGVLVLAITPLECLLYKETCLDSLGDRIFEGLLDWLLLPDLELVSNRVSPVYFEITEEESAQWFEKRGVLLLVPTPDTATKLFGL